MNNRLRAWLIVIALYTPFTAWWTWMHKYALPEVPRIHHSLPMMDDFAYKAGWEECIAKRRRYNRREFNSFGYYDDVALANYTLCSSDYDRGIADLATVRNVR